MNPLKAYLRKRRLRELEQRVRRLRELKRPRVNLMDSGAWPALARPQVG